MIDTCSLDGCNRERKKRGLCSTHYARWHRHGDPGSAGIVSPGQGLAFRFWSKVDRKGPDECWLWTAATNEHGYGVMRPEGQRSGPTVKAHRVSLVLAGQDPGELGVLHSCDNPPCVNPAHLRPGTEAENMQDAIARERISRGSQRPLAKLTEAGVVEIWRLSYAGVMQKTIATQFGVAPTTINKVLSGATWRHVTPPDVEVAA